MKKFICLTLAILILFPNAVFSKENWVYVSAPNGKQVEVDTSSIGIIGNDVTFNARAEVNKEKYFYTMRMNLEEKTMKIGDIQKYTKNGTCGILKSNDAVHNRYVKSGTLDESMLLFIDDTTKYDIRREDWNEWLPYHIKAMKTVKKNWKPKFDGSKYRCKYHAICEIKVDRFGNITDYDITFPDDNFGYRAESDSEFCKSIEDAVRKTGRLKRLPKNYKGESIRIKMAFVYHYNKDDKKNLLSNIDDKGYHEVNILKKKEPSYRLQNAFSQTGKVLCATCKFLGQAIVFTIVAGAVVAFGIFCFM